MTATIRALIPILGRNSGPCRQNLMQKIELCNVAAPLRQQVGRCFENIVAVQVFLLISYEFQSTLPYNLFKVSNFIYSRIKCVYLR